MWHWSFVSNLVRLIKYIKLEGKGSWGSSESKSTKKGNFQKQIAAMTYAEEQHGKKSSKFYTVPRLWFPSQHLVHRPHKWCSHYNTALVHWQNQRHIPVMNSKPTRHPTPTCKRECTNITCVHTSKISCEEPFKRGRVNVHTHVQMISETTLGPDKKRAVDPTSLILM